MATGEMDLGRTGRSFRCLLGRHLLGLRAAAHCVPGVSISFDDAYVDEWFSLKGLFGRYGARATFFVSNFDRLPAGQVEKLKGLRDEGHEIAFHGLRHLDAGRFIEEQKNSLAEHGPLGRYEALKKYLEEEIFPGLEAMHKCGFSPESFSYPYGARSAFLDTALLRYFKRIRGIANAKDGERLADVWRIYSRRSERGKVVFAAGIDNIYKNSIDDIREAMKKAAGRKQVLLLYAHETSDAGGGYCTPASRMEAVLELASSTGLKFYRIRDL